MVALRLAHRRGTMDFVTGIGNRFNFQKKYQCQLRSRKEFYLIMFDIDNFKACNDQYGHCFGDEVLSVLAYIVKNRLPENAEIFRYGGEEFTVIVHGMERDEVLSFAEEFRTLVSSYYWENGYQLTVSIGIAYSENAKNPLEEADRCLYESKRNGKNRISFHF